MRRGCERGSRRRIEAEGNELLGRCGEAAMP